MILKKCLYLINLLETKVFCIYKIPKIIVIYKNKNFILVIFYIIMSNFKYFKNKLKAHFYEISIQFLPKLFS